MWPASAPLPRALLEGLGETGVPRGLRVRHRSRSPFSPCRGTHCSPCPGHAHQRAWSAAGWVICRAQDESPDSLCDPLTEPLCRRHLHQHHHLRTATRLEECNLHAAIWTERLPAPL